MMTPEQAEGLAGFLLNAIENEHEITRKVLAAVPENQLEFKLGEKGRTTRELMWHIAESDVWFADSIAAGEFGNPGEASAPSTAAEIVSWYEQNPPSRLAKCKTVPREQWTKVVGFFNVFHLPLVTYLNFWNVHCIHHRGQLSSYLRAMNAHVPSIYGGSADEPFETPATTSA